MKKILIFIFTLVIIYFFRKSEISEFQKFVQKNEPILNIGDFLSEKKWNKVALVSPDHKFCLADDCITSSDESEQFLVFIQDEKS